ncbi:MAG: hypothetical protein E7317_10365 [Clostridiales bacterium]|nr:hypothetical protein [Clostridiales bacterium]
MKKTMRAVVLIALVMMIPLQTNCLASGLFSGLDDLLGGVSGLLDDGDAAAKPSRSFGTETVDVKLASGMTVSVRRDFKELMDFYEDFFDDYVKVITAPVPDPLKSVQMASDMLKYEEELDALENEDLTDAELTYYLEVTARIEQKLLLALD